MAIASPPGIPRDFTNGNMIPRSALGIWSTVLTCRRHPSNCRPPSTTVRGVTQSRSWIWSLKPGIARWPTGFSVKSPGAEHAYTGAFLASARLTRPASRRCAAVSGAVAATVNDVVSGGPEPPAPSATALIECVPPRARKVTAVCAPEQVISGFESPLRFHLIAVTGPLSTALSTTRAPAVGDPTGSILTTRGGDDEEPVTV